MASLAELNASIRELTDLWQICKDDERAEELLDKRDTLDSQAIELANKIIHEGTDELSSAITALNDLTESAVLAKNEVESTAARINKTAKAIDKATTAIAKVAVLLV